MLITHEQHKQGNHSRVSPPALCDGCCRQEPVLPPCNSIHGCCVQCRTMVVVVVHLVMRAAVRAGTLCNGIVHNPRPLLCVHHQHAKLGRQAGSISSRAPLEAARRVVIPTQPWAAAPTKQLKKMKCLSSLSTAPSTRQLYHITSNFTMHECLPAVQTPILQHVQQQ